MNPWYQRGCEELPPGGDWREQQACSRCGGGGTPWLAIFSPTPSPSLGPASCDKAAGSQCAGLERVPAASHSFRTAAGNPDTKLDEFFRYRIWLPVAGRNPTRGEAKQIVKNWKGNAPYNKWCKGYPWLVMTNTRREREYWKINIPILIKRREPIPGLQWQIAANCGMVPFRTNRADVKVQ